MGYGICSMGIFSGLLLALSACSAVSDVQQKQERSVKRYDFSEEDKRIARALSIGSEVHKSNAPPQYEAALCNLALATIAEQLRNSDLLSAQQLKAFEQAQSVYRRRAAAGLSPEEREKTRNDVEAAYPDHSDRARFAMGCLRELA